MIETPILDLLGIDRDTDLDISTDGQRLIVTPVRHRRRGKVLAASRRVMRGDDRTFRKLAK